MQAELIGRRTFVAGGLCSLLPLALGACGGSGERTVKGRVVAVDAAATTFGIVASDGKRYDFRVKPGSEVDLVHVKEHLDSNKEVEVRYTGTSAPYEASYAH